MRKQRVRRYISKHGFDSTADEMYTRLIRKKFHRIPPPRPLKPLIKEERVRNIGEDGDAVMFYGFAPIDPDGMTDDEIRKELYDAMEVRICSPYDCTGKLFTSNIYFHRNPNGYISYIHTMQLDV